MNIAFQSWQLFAVGSALFAALTAILGKIGVAGVSSDIATWIRTIVIFVVLSLILTVKRGWQLTGITQHTLLFLALSGVATGLSWLCYYQALKMGPASKVAPVDKLSVVFAILLAAIFLGEKLTWTTVLGAALITAGSLLIALA